MKASERRTVQARDGEANRIAQNAARTALEGVGKE
jgi:hypothetical protein